MYKKILKTILYIAVLVMLIWLLRQFDLNSFINYMKEIPLTVILALISLQVITQCLINYQWHSIAKALKQKSSFLKMMHIYTKGSLVEMATPGAKIGGEVTRLYLLKESMSYTTGIASSIIAIQKSISMSVLFLLCTLSFGYVAFNLDMAMSSVSKILVIVVLVIIICAIITMLFFSNYCIRLLSKTRNKLLRKCSEWLTIYASNTKKIQSKEWIKQFAIACVIWGLYPLKMIILTYTFGINVNPLFIIAITFTAYIVGVLPITPGGIGSFEGTMLTLFMLLAIDTSKSAAITFVFRFITFWLVILLSFLFVIIYEVINRKLLFTGGLENE